MSEIFNSPRERAELLVEGILRDYENSMRRMVNIYNNGNEVLDGVIIPAAMRAIEAAGLAYDDKKEIAKAAKENPIYTGRQRNLCRLVNLPFQAVPWEKAIGILAYSYTRERTAGVYIKPGDFIDIPVNVESAEIMDCEYEAIHIEFARLVVTKVFPDKIILNFEDVIAYGPMNSNDTNAGGFKATALAKYLNTVFLESVFGKVKQFLAPNRDGLLVSIPTHFEVFGSGQDVVNWGDPVRHDYFMKCQNRIKVGVDDKDDTKYWWNYDPTASNSTNFAYVYDVGYSYCSTIASYTDGGIAPAICIS